MAWGRRRRRNHNVRNAATMAEALRDSFSGDVRSATRSASVRKILGEWLDSVNDLLELYPDSLLDTDFGFGDFHFTVEGVTSDGMIWAQCDTSESPISNFNLFINRPGAGVVPAGCSCSQSRGELPCVHGLFFVDFLRSQLDFAYSPLARQILNNDFSTEKPAPGLFEFNEEVFVRRVLAQLPTVEFRVGDESKLPPVSESKCVRVAWNFSVDQSGVLTVNPVLQQAKKRGKGFTKGRRMSIQNFFKHTEGLSKQDHAIKELIEFEDSYYRPELKWNVDHVMARLVGAENVVWGQNSIEVKPLIPILALERDKEHCWVSIDETLPGDRIQVSSSTIVRSNLEAGYVDVCQLPPEYCECIAALTSLPRLPLAYEPQLAEKLRAVQGAVNCKFPDEYFGKLVEEECTQVILLRSHADGSLDYGFRVRSGDGKLHTPGGGLLVRTGERDGETVQLQRGVDREREQAVTTASFLGLDQDETEGSISDFGFAIDFLGRLQELEETGMEVLWDESSDKPIRVLGSVTSQNVSVGIKQKRDWFQISGKCAVGGESLELVDVLAAMQEVDNLRGEFVRVGDKGWTRIETKLRTQLQRLRESVVQDRRSLKFDATSAPDIREFLDSDIEVKTTRAFQKTVARLTAAETLEPELPEGLNATLREYQIDGFKWLRRLAEWGVGGVLADDMGLGKTLQTLAVILDRSVTGPTLVIAPTSVGFNWVREAERFAPELHVQLYRETDRAAFLQTVSEGSVVVCSYGLALRDAKQLAGVAWSTLVLDEAQAIKNSRSKTSIAIAGIPADWKVALTGTPVENHLGELWSLFHVISPGVFGGWDQFRNRYASPIERDGNEDRRKALCERLKPFVLRRTKGEVLTDLPPRSEMNILVDLSPAEREMYDQVRLSAIGEIDKIAKLDDVKDQRFRILALLTRMRQLACSPQLVHEAWTERSSKLKQLCETLSQLKEEGHRVLIFSQFVKHLTLIRKMLEQELISYEYLDGSTPAAERQTRVDRFQEGDSTAFLISLKAGGTGLNLTAADYVIHMDPWWNPAVEDQATDRAHRIGQDRPVMVYRFISQGTIEEEMLSLHDTKRDLVSGVMDGTHSAAKLSTEDLIAMVRGSR